MKLYAVLLGGSGGPGRFSEDHETVFVVASDEKAAKAQARTKWSGHGRAHVDALEELTVVDGHGIELVAAAGAEASGLISYNDLPFDEEDGEG